MLKDTIFTELQVNNSKFDSYRYYVCMNIDGVDYIAKIVVGVKQGKKYYDQRLTELQR